jgi:GAF domain-containing protein/CheY-like chemotaxis protein
MVERYEFTTDELTLVDAITPPASVAIEKAPLLGELSGRQASLAALLETSRQLSKIRSLDVLLECIAEACGGVLGASSVGFRVVEGENLVVAGAWGDSAEVITQLPLKVGESLIGLVASSGEPMIVEDPASDPRMHSVSRDTMRRLGHRAWMGVPLKSGGRVRGVLGIRTTRESGFSPDDLVIAEAFAAQASTAIENAQLYQESAAHQWRLATMVEVAHKLTSQLDLPAVLDTVANAAAELFGAEVGFRLIEGDELVLCGATPGARRVMVRERIKIGESISGRVAATGEPIVTTDIPGDARLIPEHRVWGERTAAMMCVPIRGGCRILGTLNIYRASGQRFDDDALGLAMSLANQAGVAVENARLYDEAARRRREAEALARIGAALAEQLDVSAVAAQIGQSVRELLGARTAVLRLLEPDGSLRGIAFEGASRQNFEPGHVSPAGDGLGPLAIAAGGTVRIPDARTDPRLTLTEEMQQAFDRAGVGSFLSVPLRARGKIIGVVNIGDVAGRVYSDGQIALVETFAAQAAVAIENARLYQEAREAYQQLAETQQQLVQSQKIEAIGQLAGGIAHDFNNLMTVVIGRAQLLRHGLGADHPLVRHVNLIEKTAGRTATITRQLLAFSRKQRLQPEIIEVNGLVSRMGAMLRALLGEDIDLVTDLAPNLWPVRADAAQVEQVVMNLAINARDAMPSGGRLTIETGNVTLDRTYARRDTDLVPGPYVMVAVSDTGTGMDTDTLSHIFEPFFTTKEPGKGTGLGLATVYGIVKQSGGHIFVYSEPSVGTIFKVYLPRVNTVADVDVAEEQPAAAPRGMETILLVEDEQPVRELLQEVLKDLGYTVLAAPDGQAAVTVSEAHTGPIALVLTDVIMPGMSGPDLVRRLEVLHPEANALYMSGYTDAAIVRLDVLDGGTAFIQKPFTPAGVAAKVREVLARSGQP